MAVVHLQGPLFVSVFNPLVLVFVAIAGLLLLDELLHVGSCYEIEQKREDRERHPVNHRDKHPIYPIKDIVDGYLPHLIVPEQGYRRLIESTLITIKGHVWAAVDTTQYAQHNDAILLVVIPAALAPEVAYAKALRLAKEFDGESTRTIGVVSKIDQASSDPKILAAVQALLLGQGPWSATDIPWVALIGQSVSIASAQLGSVGSDNSSETAWRAESESLKSILTEPLRASLVD